jgi:hypothetical protein
MTIAIQDPLNLLADPKLSFLSAALDPLQVQQQFQSQIFHHAQRIEALEVQAIRVIRHKPQRRCLIEYDVRVEQQNRIQFMTWIGKVQAKRFKPSSYQLQKLLWDYGFQGDSPDGISVPEPIGLIPEWHMWLQQKVPGISATEILATPAGIPLAPRIAEAADKLHRAWIIPQRFHSLKDELAILHDRLTQVAQQFPLWQSRLTRVLAACDRMAATIPPPHFRGIHRDFYPDQILVDGSRLYLLDFDLFAGGDPGLDIGNFNGHLIEYGLRRLGNPMALAAHQSQLTEKFVQISEGTSRHTIEAYTTLTLVRHIFLSTQFPDRRSSTEAILDHCEQRLSHAIENKYDLVTHNL